MQREQYLRIYNLHSWSGICLGLFIYIVAFTGCLALFADELKTWEDPRFRLNVPEQAVSIMPIFSNWVESNSVDKKIRFVSFFYPSHKEPYYRAIMGVSDNVDVTQENLTTAWNAETGETLRVRKGGLTEWVLDFHRDLMWPKTLGGRTVGRALVGVAGVILMLSIISGIITHTKIIKQMFTLRVKRSSLLKWQDLHKVMGLWPLPFHIMISFTGAFLGIVAVLAPLTAVIAFKGDTDALVRAVTGPEVQPTGISAPMLSVDDVWNIKFEHNQANPARIIIENWGDENAEYDLLYDVDTELASFHRLSVSAVTGKVLRVESANAVSTANRLNNAMSPLHYATYGGVWLKVIYFALGLILCVMTVTGLIIWIERRLHGKEGRLSPRLYDRISRVTLGVTLGLPVASAAIFYLDKLYFGAEVFRLTATGMMYFAVWFLCIAYAFIKADCYRAVRDLFLLTSILICLIPLLNYLMVGDSLIDGIVSGSTWAWVDVSALILGSVMLVVTFLLPKQRSASPREQREAAIAVE